MNKYLYIGIILYSLIIPFVAGDSKIVETIDKGTFEQSVSRLYSGKIPWVKIDKIDSNIPYHQAVDRLFSKLLEYEKETSANDKAILDKIELYIMLSKSLRRYGGYKNLLLSNRVEILIIHHTSKLLFNDCQYDLLVAGLMKDYGDILYTNSMLISLLEENNTKFNEKDILTIESAIRLTAPKDNGQHFNFPDYKKLSNNYLFSNIDINMLLILNRSVAKQYSNLENLITLLKYNKTNNFEILDDFEKFKQIYTSSDAEIIFHSVNQLHKKIFHQPEDIKQWFREQVIEPDVSTAILAHAENYVSSALEVTNSQQASITNSSDIQQEEVPTEKTQAVSINKARPKIEPSISSDEELADLIFGVTKRNLLSALMMAGGGALLVMTLLYAFWLRQK